MLNFAIYVSDHGFGHATRMAALAEEFIRFGVFVHVRAAQPGFIWRNLDANFSRIHPVACDVGVKHGHDLTPDLESTKSALLGLMGQRGRIIEREVEFLRAERIDLIVADIPWLAVEAGTYAGVPVFAISNFDWLFIYARLFQGDAVLRPLLNTIFGLYQRVDRAFRLPLSSARSMACFRKPESTGLLAARKAAHPDLKRDLGIDAGIPLLVCSFGGAGEMELDLKPLCSAFEGRVAAKLPAAGIANYVQVAQDADFSALIGEADILLTKPGYSSFAEAIQGAKHLIYHRRDNYPEEEILIRGIARYPAKTELPSLKLSQTAWRKVFRSVQNTPGPAKRIPNANPAIAATIIQRFIELRHGGRKLLSVFDLGSNNLNYALSEEGLRRPIHTAQIQTGLGSRFRELPNGRIVVPAKGLAAFKKAVSAFMVFDRGIDSSKQAIATGIHRRGDFSEDLATWFEKRWKTRYRVLSEAEEAQLVALAAGELVPEGRKAVIVDIGGFSTEVVLQDGGKKPEGLSLPLGLLTLHRTEMEGGSADAAITQALQAVPDFKPDLLICVGLSAVFLAKIIKKIPKYQPAGLHGAVVGRTELEHFMDLASSGEADELMCFAVEKQSLPFLLLSTRYFVLLLDKFGTSEFVVCQDGISFGFKYWKKRKR